ncbi:cyclopropane fatty acyl phospholipid synthase [Candidatus Gracilibacteria bacterium]|nr:cyclopropane fatty acyl phospholipid synthase [Candidatus Gracilibacteria bacterium]
MSFIKDRGIELFNKADVTINGSRPWDIQVHNEKFFSKLLFHGTIALGESYVDGLWDCDDIEQCVYRLLKADLINLKTGDFKNLGFPFAGKLRLIGPILRNFQSKKTAKYNAKFHYNLGNDLFVATLGKKTMTYSCGYWKNAKTLDEAQINKMDLICKKLKLQPGMNILEIGCGWGNFAKFAAEKYKVNVTGITLSDEQFNYAEKHNSHKNVKFLIQDYRNIKGEYERIVSIGMIEHVGPKNHRTFMKKANDCLRKDGLMLIQSIGISETAIKNDPWVDKYLFPGSVPMSAKQFCDSSEGLFYILDWHDFTKDYHKTINAWLDNFDKNWDKLKVNYDDRFYRYWKWYLTCCPATALAMTHHLWQVVFGKVGSDKGYERIS